MRPEVTGPDEAAPSRREIRSYVVRGGRLTTAQQRALEEYWPRYGLEYGGGRIDLTTLFGRDAPRTLEIGFGNGDNLAQLAAMYPEQDFIGVEVHPPGVGHLLLKAAQGGIGNLRIVQHDAVELLRDSFHPASLDAILALFPDPWHKKRHHKRRLVSREFAELALSRLKPGGTLQLATDWTPYAEWMLEILDAVQGLRNCSADGRYMPRNLGRAATRFEQRGERLGHAVHDLCYERVSLTADDCAA
ncbi:MAG: tRNA (guanosine(46)-N7)-methyltransferase TrmB [Steroidobacteraceae bacterium]